jgi:hypothetical protein
MLEWIGLLPLLGLTGNWRGYRMGGKAIGGANMPTDLKKKFEAFRAAGDMDKAHAIADRVQKFNDDKKAEMAEKPEKQKGKTKFNHDGKNATEAGFTIKDIKAPVGVIGEKLQTEKGTPVSVEISNGEFFFSINNTVNSEVSKATDPLAAGKLAFRGLQDLARKLPDGTLVNNAPVRSDRSGAARERVYQKFGFGERINGKQWGIVKGGKIYPVDEKFYTDVLSPHADKFKKSGLIPMKKYTAPPPDDSSPFNIDDMFSF